MAKQPLEQGCQLHKECGYVRAVCQAGFNDILMSLHTECVLSQPAYLAIPTPAMAVKHAKMCPAEHLC